MARERVSYNEADAEAAGIKAYFATKEKARKANLTWQEMVMEGMRAEEFRLKMELEKLQTIAAKIPRTENQIAYHRDKMARFKEAHGL